MMKMNRYGLVAALSALACCPLLGCSSGDGGKVDSAVPDTAPDTTRLDVIPGTDQAPAAPDLRDNALPAEDTASLDADRVQGEVGPFLDTAKVEGEVGRSLDTADVDGAPPLDGGVAIDASRSAVQRIVDPQIPAADADTLAADNAAFAFAAYQKLIASSANVVFSPASISIALAMTYAGAAGTTASEMAQAMHYSLPPARLHPAFNALDQALASRGQGQPGADGGPMRLRIVNSLWAEQTFAFRADFLDLLGANYGAPVYLVDFATGFEPARQTINAWVADQTEDKIQELLPPDSIDQATKLVLTNAVYLNAQWQTTFESTFDGPFTLADGSQITVKRMAVASLTVPAVQSAGFKAVSLPYADNRLSLVVVVPEAGQFAQVESTLDADGLLAIVASMTSKRVGLNMPRFKIETTTKLADLLEQLGMKAAFSPTEADFSGMNEGGGLYIGGAYHKAFIDVGEKGTEAAAATAVVMKDASAPMIDLYMTIDRPFLYYLRDAPTGAILFMGRVLDPSKG